MSADGQLLFVVLGEGISVLPIDSALHELEVEGCRFTREDDFDAHSYYDWLRNQDGKVIGLRLDLVEESQYIIEKLEVLDYVRTENKKTYFKLLYIFFGNERNYDAKRSDDQAFWDCFLYFSQGGVVGMTFLLPSGESIIGCDGSRIST